MTLHCAGRLGILAWMYEQRHMIAFELGLIKEKPIAECGSSYLEEGLVIVQQDHTQARPSAVFSAKEINLFFGYHVIEVSAGFSLINPIFSDPVDLYSSGPCNSIFRPPLAA
jgi:hypothetical protein